MLACWGVCVESWKWYCEISFTHPLCLEVSIQKNSIQYSKVEHFIPSKKKLFWLVKARVLIFFNTFQLIYSSTVYPIQKSNSLRKLWWKPNKKWMVSSLIYALYYAKKAARLKCALAALKVHIAFEMARWRERILKRTIRSSDIHDKQSNFRQVHNS